MRHNMIAAIAIAVLTACTGTDAGDRDAGTDAPQPQGPALGYYKPHVDFDWWCTEPDSAGGGDCNAPAPFSGAEPDAIEIRGGGEITWLVVSGEIEHRGTVEASCIVVPGGVDSGQARAPYSICSVPDAGPPQVTADIIKWGTGTDECWCGPILLDRVDM